MMYFGFVGKGRGTYKAKVTIVPSRFHGGWGKSSVVEQINEANKNQQILGQPVDKNLRYV